MAMRYYAPFPDRDGGPKPLPRHVLRIGDAERDAAAADLGDHYVAGRLTLDELHDRLGEVFAARTHGQLWKVMADLPVTARRQAWRAAAGTPAVTRPDRRNDTASDQAARFAALSLLILAMLIWLLTAFLFARHSYVHPGPPPWPPGR